MTALGLGSRNSPWVFRRSVDSPIFFLGVCIPGAYLRPIRGRSSPMLSELATVTSRRCFCSTYLVERSVYTSKRSTGGLAPTVDRVVFLKRLAAAFAHSATVLLIYGHVNPAA